MASAFAGLSGRTSQTNRILVVDDEQAIRELNTRWLTRAGYQVDAVVDGVAAWDALQQNNYDLMITDNTMPRMTGTALVEKVRAAGMQMPVIMASGTFQKQVPAGDARLPTLNLLPKPYRDAELVTMVKKVLACTGPGYVELN